MARLPSAGRALWGEGLISPASPSPPWHTVGAQPYKMLLWRLSTLRLGSCEAAVLNPTLQWKKPVQGSDVVHPKSHNWGRTAWPSAPPPGLRERKKGWIHSSWQRRAPPTSPVPRPGSIRPDPAAPRAQEERDSSLNLIGPYRLVDSMRSACGSLPFTSALPSRAPLLCLPAESRLNWLSCHL